MRIRVKATSQKMLPGEAGREEEPGEGRSPSRAALSRRVPERVPLTGCSGRSAGHTSRWAKAVPGAVVV